MLARLPERGLAAGAIPLFAVRIQLDRQTSFLAMLGMVGYDATVLQKKDLGANAVELLLDLSGTDRVAELLLTWLRTIPGVEEARLAS